MTYRRPTYIPLIMGAQMSGWTNSYSNGNIRAFYLPEDLTLNDKVFLMCWHYGYATSAGTVHIGKNNTTTAGVNNAAGLTEFDSAVSADLETVGASAFNMNKSSTSEILIDVTQDMVDHAAAGKGFSLGFKRSNGAYLYMYCVNLMLRRV